MAATSTTSNSLSVASIMAAYGVPENVWKPIQAVESGGNPNAYVSNGAEESVGLFQLNRKNGLGVGYSVAQLKDPTINATIAAKQMGPLVRDGMEKGLSGYDLTIYVAGNGGWPTQMGTAAVPQTYASRLLAAFNNLFNNSGGSNAGGSSGSSGSNGTSGSSSSGSSGGSSSLGSSKISGSLGPWDISLTNPFSIATDKLSSWFWLIVGVAVVFLGVKLITNPLSNLTDIVGKVTMGAVKDAE